MNTIHVTTPEILVFISIENDVKIILSIGGDDKYQLKLSLYWYLDYSFCNVVYGLNNREDYYQNLINTII